MKSKQTMLVLQGLPASGKSTWAKRLLADKPNEHWKRINKDDLRAMIDNGKWSKEREKFIVACRNVLIGGALSAGYNVIVDDTNLHPNHCLDLEVLAKRKGVEFKIKFFDVRVEEAIRRDAKRGDKSVGSQVIRRMHQQFIRPKLKVDQDKSLRHIVICDLDGTLALHNGRTPFEYDKCDTDLVNEPIRNILWTSTGIHSNIVFMSGREETCRDKTLAWLNKEYGIVRMEGVQLLMRKKNDTRSDYVVKKELYEEHIKGKYHVDFVLDDRNSVVELWRDLGFTCLQVNDGDF